MFGAEPFGQSALVFQRGLGAAEFLLLRYIEQRLKFLFFEYIGLDKERLSGANGRSAVDGQLSHGLISVRLMGTVE